MVESVLFFIIIIRPLWDSNNCGEIIDRTREQRILHIGTLFYFHIHVRQTLLDIFWDARLKPYRENNFRE